MAEKAGKDIYLYSEGAAKKKTHQSRDRAKARERQTKQPTAAPRADQSVASVVWGGKTKRG